MQAKSTAIPAGKKKSNRLICPPFDVHDKASPHIPWQGILVKCIPEAFPHDSRLRKTLQDVVDNIREICDYTVNIQSEHFLHIMFIVDRIDKKRNLMVPDV